MKRLFIFITVVCALFVTSCYEDSTTNDRISNLENDKIASIEEQINAILSTLSVLKEETHPLILSKIGVLESNAESNAELIATLKAQAESVANQISELTNHCKQLEDSIGLYGEKEWIETTFATLEQYANLQSVVASLQANISGLSEEIKSAITKVESSMKDWVSVQLSSYCTIAEMEAQLAELRAANKDNDEAITAKIAELEKTIEAVYHEITAAYQQAIADAISNNNGEINKKIAKDIASAETRIDSKLETINAEINDIKVRLNILEAKISDIESQITKINATLDLLQMVDALLDERLISLEAKLAHDEKTYLAQIEELKAKIAGLEAEKAEIEKSIADNSADIEKLNLELEACVEYIRSLQNELIDMQAVMYKLQCEIQAEIAAIEAEQALLEEQIEALKAYVDNELSKKADKDWAEATFATLEQYAQMQTLLDELQQQIASLKQDENEGGTNVDSSAIEDAIKAAEESMKDWVAEELAGYCTISQLEAKLEVLRKELDQNGAYTQDQIAGMEARIAELSEQLAAMMMAYQKALDDISAILHNYQAENDARIHDILAEMEEMQVRHTEDIAYIKNTIDKLWDFIYNRIQSITYIPQYTDEKATIVKSHNADEGIGELDFLILPKEAVKKIQVNDVSMKAVETISRAVNFIDMPIISVKPTDLANGVLTVRVSGKNLGDDFYEGKKEFKATLIISNGEDEISSEFITLTPQVEEGSTSTNNKIFYTSSDGKVVEPTISSWEKSFNVNIVSNTYANGQGVITFDGELTLIGWETFRNCTTLTSMTIPDSVTTIESNPFMHCDKLTAFYSKHASADNRCLIVDGVLIAFAPAGLTKYTIPDGVTTIGGVAFCGCSSLKEVTIPDSVTKIGNNAFDDCTSLTSVTIPDSVTTFGQSPFDEDFALTAFYSKFASADNRCLIVDGVLIAFAPAGLTEYTIPNGVTAIGEHTFISCSSLTSVTIPNSVTTIGSTAFYKCTSLKEVYCKPTTPPSLGGSNVFDYNASDRKIYVPAASLETYKAAEGWKEYADYIFPMPEESQNNKIFYTSSDGNVVTPYKTDVFGANIVSNTYTNGQGVIVLNGDATKIGSCAFWGCTALTSVTIPDSVTEILYGAFYECTSLTNITIPDSVTTIGDHAFYSCSALTSITIPDSVMTIGDSAFHSCTSLKSITIPDSVTSIGEYAFVRCSALTSITIPDSVTSIENNVFVNCSSLTSVTIPNSVTSIGEYAFSNCSALTSITIPDSVISIEKCVFNDCSSLKSVTIPDSVTEIGKSVFWRCTALTNVTIPDSVTEIGELTFFLCSALTSITIPDSVTTIGNNAFANCYALTSITIPNSVTTIGDSAFTVCNALTSITIPDSVTTIGSGAFASCKALTSVTIGNSITSIGKNAFNWCHVLKEVYCKPTTPPSFGGYIFDNNASGRKIYVPTDSVAAYKLTDGWNSYSYHIEPYNFTE